MSELRAYVKNWESESLEWKQGWISYENDPSDYDNPHLKKTFKHEEFENGWNEAIFTSKVDGGYYDE